LIAIVIFSIGMLGLLGLQVNAIRLSSEAKYRADAAFLADALIGQLSVSDPANLAAFAHQSGGAGCGNWSGATTTNNAITAWLEQVNQVLPGAGSDKHQVKINTADKQVEITLCWQSAQGEPRAHKVATILQIQ
jgi:type IV pilus assembly protein PilV